MDNVSCVVRVVCGAGYYYLTFASSGGCNAEEAVTSCVYIVSLHYSEAQRLCIIKTFF
jgi:hypothetical protein